MKGLETRHVAALLLVSLAFLGFMLLPGGKSDSRARKASMELELGFRGDVIPEKYTCDGQNISPPVRFQELPEETETVALIMDDPDAPVRVFDHWAVWNVTSGRLDEGLPAQEKLTSGAVQGTNDFGDVGYSGPCPPTGTHTYRFRAYALESPMDLEPGAPADELEAAVEKHAIAQDTVRREY
ncbi:MAG: YbhB/YbcL family Raf kinase inhibitor-like protein [Candidatus Nanohaloarchaea archaeon]